MPGNSPIQFRFDPDYRKRLDAEAEKFNMSAGTYARQLVMDALDNAEMGRLKEEVAELQEEVSKLKAAMGEVYTILKAQHRPDDG